MNEFFGMDLLVQHGVTPRAITHIGAHYGQEASHYREYVGESVIWVEAHPDYFDALLENPSLGDQLAVQACVSDRTGEVVDFYITKDEYASSLLKPEYHQVQNPHAPVVDIIPISTVRYDHLLEFCSEAEREAFMASNVLVLDVQGAEMMVLSGMETVLGQFDAIATEYSTVEFYKDGPRLQDLDDFLWDDFRRVEPDPAAGDDVLIHADALYINSRLQ